MAFLDINDPLDTKKCVKRLASVSAGRKRDSSTNERNRKNMGYYTDFELTVDRVNPLLRADLEEEIRKMNVFDPGNVDTGWSVNAAKWYDHDEDMLLLSRRFPDTVFTLYGYGDSIDDRWVSYYKSGAQQYAEAVIIYADFDENQLVPAQIDLSSDKKYSYQT